MSVIDDGGDLVIVLHRDGRSGADAPGVPCGRRPDRRG
jgi:hypothetical protein